MRVDFAFGRTGLIVDLPTGFRYQILEARSARPLADAVSAVEAALDSPIGSRPLEELARGRESAAISVCDITRPAPNPIVLPPTLHRLERAGIPPERITILIATGLHRPATEAEIREICGDSVAGRYRAASWDTLLDRGGKLVQAKAVRLARTAGVRLTLAAPGGGAGTEVGPWPARLGPPGPRERRPLRVVLLGLGTVGAAVFRARPC